MTGLTVCVQLLRSGLLWVVGRGGGGCGGVGGAVLWRTFAFFGCTHNRCFSLLVGLTLSLSQVCIVATGVVGDLCRALEQDILPYCQHIMGWLMVNLEGADINRSVFFFFFSCRVRASCRSRRHHHHHDFSTPFFVLCLEFRLRRKRARFCVVGSRQSICLMFTASGFHVLCVAFFFH